MQKRFRLLFSPLKIGPVTIRNRIMSTAHATSIVDSGPIVGGPGFMGEAYAYYQGDRAKGGAGLIICGQTAVHPVTAWEHWDIMIAYDKKAIPGFRLVTDAIHKYGATPFLQLFHSGSNNALYGEATKGPLLSASSLAAAGASEPPKAMEIEDIEEAIEYYGISADNAKAGGFDGIEIHSTHGYLPQQFLSPLTNKRTDEYGGSLENRMRFLMRIIDRVKQAIGNDMALGVRLCGDELHAGGITPNDAAQIAQILEATGKVDLINVSVGHLSFARLLTIPPMYVPSGYGLYASTAVRAAVESIPVAVTGRIVDPVHAEKILADGNADIVGMTRALIADPELPNKAR